MDDVRMIDETCAPYRLLASIRRRLTVQQYRTIRGQLRAGDVDGAVRGIKRLTEGESLRELMGDDFRQEFPWE